MNESVAGNLQKSSTWISPQSLNRDLITQFPSRVNVSSLLSKNTEGTAAASSIHDNTVTSLNNTSLSCLGKISPPFTRMKGGDLSPRLWIDTAAIPYDTTPPSTNPSCLNGGGRHLLRQKHTHISRRGFIWAHYIERSLPGPSRRWMQHGRILSSVMGNWCQPVSCERLHREQTKGWKYWSKWHWKTR